MRNGTTSSKPSKPDKRWSEAGRTAAASAASESSRFPDCHPRHADLVNVGIPPRKYPELKAVLVHFDGLNPQSWIGSVLLNIDEVEGDLNGWRVAIGLVEMDRLFMGPNSMSFQQAPLGAVIASSDTPHLKKRLLNHFRHIFAPSSTDRSIS
jgi:hypothetical protein